MFLVNPTIWLIGVSLPVVCNGVICCVLHRCTDSEWFRSLRKPSFFAGGCIASLISILTTALMACASMLVYGSANRTKIWGEPEHRVAIIAYLVQFFLNNLWPIVFFLGRQVTLSLIQVVVAKAATLFCIYLFADLEFYSVLLALPHLVWTSYWLVMLYSVWLLNYNKQQTVHEKLLLSYSEDGKRSKVKTYGVYV